MSRNGNAGGQAGGYFKDLGNFSQQFLNKVASDIRSNAENLISTAFQNEPCSQVPNSSSQASTPASSPRHNPPRPASTQSHSRSSSNHSHLNQAAPGSNSASSNSSSASTPSHPRPGGQEESNTRKSSSTSSTSQATTPDEVVADWFSKLVRGSNSGPSVASGGSSSMGNAGFCGSKRTSTVKPSDSQDSAMLCDICQVKFSFFHNRKKLCSECKAYFCGDCVSREAPAGQPQQRIGQANFGPRTCKRCKVLLSDPPVRADLMELRVKDLQRYLISKQVNTKSCVEKKDLVELVIRQNGSGEESINEGPSSNNEGSAVPPNAGRQRRAPQERQKSFPKAYVESTHRHEWLEKMENQGQEELQLSCEEDDDDFIVVTSVQPVDETAEEATEDASSTGDDKEAQDRDKDPETTTAEANNESESHQEVVEETPVETIEPEDTTRDHEDAQGASALPNSAEETPAKVEPKSEVKRSRSESLSIPSRQTGSPNDFTSMSGSPRRFANQGLVYLSEIQTIEEIHGLSVKQAKDILAMNRVNFKGVVEKDELLKHVARLWKQEKQAQAEKESMDDSDLCKICMDNPVDCVMLECGHMCTCTTCGKQMAECPICRQYVVRVVRTFKA